MTVIKPKLTPTNVLRPDRSAIFRSQEIYLGKHNETLVFKNGKLNNPMSRYELMTVPLVAGTYQFKIKSTDNLGNVNSGATASKVLSNRLWYPKNMVISAIDTNTVTLTWEQPSGGFPVTHYVVYGNNGSGFAIDRGTPIATVASTLRTATFTVADGDWFFVVESINDDLGLETTNWFTVARTLPVTATKPPNSNDLADPPVNEITQEYKLQNVNLRNVTTGKCEISFIWTYGNKASYFNIYTDNGTGTMDWNTAIHRFTRLTSVNQLFVTNQISFEEDKIFNIGIRVESPDGVIEQNTISYPVSLDGIEPDNATGITLEEI